MYTHSTVSVVCTQGILCLADNLDCHILQVNMVQCIEQV